MDNLKIIAKGNSRSLECENNDSSIYTHNIILDYNKNWPIKTDIVCWWCCHKFDSTPVPIPLTFSKNIFKVYGNFCSFNCSKAFLQSKEPLYSSYKDNCSLLSFFCKKTTGKRENIIAAPSRLSLKMFGGNLSIEDFRNNNIKLSVIKYPFIPIQTYIQREEKQVVNKVFDSKKFKVERNTVSTPVKSRGLSLLGIKIVKKEEF